MSDKIPREVPYLMGRMPHDGSAAFHVQNWMTQPRRNVTACLNFVNAKSVPRKIGIIGSHGVGKTTFANMLANELGIPRIDELARTVHALGFELDHGSTVHAQALMWLGQMYEEITLEEFVSDRTLLDVIAYGSLLLESKEDSLKDSYFINALGNITQEIVHSHYSIMFYIPVEFGPEDDGVRNTDAAWQRQVDARMVELLDAFGIDYFPITGSKQERIDTALAYLEDQGLLLGP
jgi:nicotinamide riboside kinase